jgi:Flp pilus assembly protein TadG
MVRMISRARDEDGAVLVLMSIALTVLLGFSALVVDVGNAYQQRRLAQSSADAAALAAAQELTNLSLPASVRAANTVSAAKSYAQRNFATAPSAWSGCSDPSALAIVPDLSVNNNACISLDTTLTQVRVKLPPRTIHNAFAGVLNAPTTSVGASAVALVGSPAGDRILPLGITTAAGTGNLCIENSGNNTSCASRTAGNFGDLKSPRLVRFITSDDKTALFLNLAVGIDHPIQSYGSGAGVCDGDLVSPCATTNVGTSLIANHMNTGTGNNTNPVTEGVVTSGLVDGGTTSFCGRLERPDFTDANLNEPRPGNCVDPGEPTISVLDTRVNGRHIAYWMTSAARSIFYPGANPGAQPVAPPGTPGPYDIGDVGLRCYLQIYRFNGGNDTYPDPTQCPTLVGTPVQPIFDQGIINDPRFGWIPVLSSWPSGGSSAVPVVGYWGAFMYRTYATNTKLLAIDAWVFDPHLVKAGTNTSGPQMAFQGGPANIQLLK